MLPKVFGPLHYFSLLVGSVAVVGGTGRKEQTERKDNGGHKMYLGLPLHNCIRDMRNNLRALAALDYFLVVLLLLLLLLHWTCWLERNGV